MKEHGSELVDLALDCMTVLTGRNIFTASADKTAAMYDAPRAKLIKRMVEHSSYVSSIANPKGNTSMYDELS